MPRHRQVRLSYPAEFVALALQLAQRHGRTRTAKTLGLPLSTIYRWHDEHRRGQRRGETAGAPESAEHLLVACEVQGFDLRARVRRLEPVGVVGAAGQRANDGQAAAAPGPTQRSTPTPVVPRRESAEAAPACGGAAGSVPARLLRARIEIEQRYYAPLSCEHLAGLAGMSRFHFIRRFKQLHAVAPYRYLMQVRVRHARLLLGTTHQPLDAIAAAVGFDSPSSLCKAFRSVEGITLSAFYRGVRLGAHPPQRHGAVAPALRA